MRTHNFIWEKDKWFCENCGKQVYMDMGKTETEEILLEDCYVEPEF